MVSTSNNALRPIPTLPRSSSGTSINRSKFGNRSPSSPSSPSGSTAPTPALLIALKPSTLDMESRRSDSFARVEETDIKHVSNIPPLAIDSESGMFGINRFRTRSSASSNSYSAGARDTIPEEIVDLHGVMMIPELEVDEVRKEDIVVEQVHMSGFGEDQLGVDKKKQQVSNGNWKSPPPSSWNEKPLFSEMGRTSSSTNLTGADMTSMSTRTGRSGGNSSGETKEDERSVASLIGGIEHTPTAWGANFWVVLSDPLTLSTFYACPSTGDCSWDPPVGALVLPRKPEGEWWELSDKKRAGRSYFYHTITGKTQWTRPTDDLVIPLGMIQMNALSDRPEGLRHTTEGLNAAGKKTKDLPDLNLVKARAGAEGKKVKEGDGSHLPCHHRGSAVSTHPSPRKRLPAIGNPQHPETGTVSIFAYGSCGAPAESPPRLPEKDVVIQGRIKVSGPSRPTEIAWGAAVGTSRSQQGSAISMSRSSSVLTSLPQVNSGPESSHQHDSNHSIAGSGSTGTGSESSLRTPSALTSSFPPLGKRTKGRIGFTGVNGLPSPTSTSGSFIARLRTRSRNSTSATAVNRLADLEGIVSDTELEPPPSLFTLTKSASASELRLGPILWSDDGPIRVKLPVKTKRLSTGLHPLLPTGISRDIHHFQQEDFSGRYFAKHRRGLMRRLVPLQELMEWQKQSIAAPLLQTSRSLSKDSVRSFKVIQHVMGDRDKPVDGITIVQTSSSARNIVALAEEERAMETAGLWDKTERQWLLEEERWLLQLGITRPEIRDEIYSQCMKQLTHNPDPRSLFQGFQLLCVLVVTFGPSKELESVFRTFLKRNLNGQETGIVTMAMYCLDKLDTIISKGPRSRALMFGEIEQASNAAFMTSIFGASVNEIMKFQETDYPASVPYVLTFLSEAIITLGGLSCEGIFRIPGDSDTVSEMKARLERRQYQIDGIDELHVIASLLKLWLRELREPLIPDDMYNTALDCSLDEERSCAFLFELPIYNRRVLLYLINFLQLFTADNVIADTKMTDSNLALIFAPNILRTTTTNANVVYTNSTYEARFVLNLLRSLKPKEVDHEYQPETPEVPGTFTGSNPHLSYSTS